jgi:hypothetical protein
MSFDLQVTKREKRKQVEIESQSKSSEEEEEERETLNNKYKKKKMNTGCSCLNKLLLLLLFLIFLMIIILSFIYYKEIKEEIRYITLVYTNGRKNKDKFFDEATKLSEIEIKAGDTEIEGAKESKF